MVEIHTLNWDCAVVVFSERQNKIIEKHYKSQNVLMYIVRNSGCICMDIQFIMLNYFSKRILLL